MTNLTELAERLRVRLRGLKYDAPTADLHVGHNDGLSEAIAAIDEEIASLTPKVEDDPRYEPIYGEDGKPTGYHRNAVTGEELILSAYPDLALTTPAKVEEGVRQAARALVDKLELIHADGQYMGVWTSYMIHGGNYTGPNYSAELEALKSALAASPSGERVDRIQVDDAVGAMRAHFLPFETSKLDRRFNEGVRAAIEAVRSLKSPQPEGRQDG